MMPPRLRFDFGQPLCFENPTDIIIARTLAEVRPALRMVQAATEAGKWAAGYVAYEAAPAFDPALRVHSQPYDLPLLWFGIFDGPREDAPNPNFGEPEARGGGTPPFLSRGQGQALPLLLTFPFREGRNLLRGRFPPGEWQPDSCRNDYDRSIMTIRKAIAAGDVYQVNHTFRLRSAYLDEPSERMSTAATANLDLGRFRIISASPELFFHLSGRHITTRPMKGTRPRGRWAEEDAQIAVELAASEKDRAENVMIVDLLRNDLGRIAVPGSVHVPKLFEIEHYPTVHQMTSTIEAELWPEITLEEIFAALFPCGSVTGAPKISAMQKISALENSPRQVYCGAIGYIAPHGEAMFRVAIRTALLDTQVGLMEYGVGGGIVWDSTAESEYSEALAKAAVLSETVPEFELLETLHWQGGQYVLLDRHLDRLLASAVYFGFCIERSHVQSALLEAATGWGTAEMRVRLRVSPSGEITIESVPLVSLPEGPLPVALAQTPVSRRDRFLCHKTTHRAVYDAHKAMHPAVFDVLLWNEDGELTEFTLGNLVVELDGILWTPPRECGLLNGTLREELLATGQLQERILRREDLLTAGLWLINSVRGFAPVSLR